MLIECKDLTYRYPGSDTDVFKQLSCRITGPGFHALFGASGVGKTTLAKILSTEIQAHQDHIARLDIQHILYSYNLERLPGWHTIGEHLKAVALPSRNEKITELVDLFGLRNCLHSRFVQLSLGQQNRTNLLRYLLQDFDALIMDESLANVDEATRENIILKIKEMFPTKCFLYISHNIQEISKLCRQILVLRTSHRTPQAICVHGRDYQKGEAFTKKDLERSILEVIDAA